MSKVKVKLLHPQAYDSMLRGSELAVGYDLVSAEAEHVLLPGESHLFRTGIALELPHDLEAQVRPRSGLSTRYSVIIPNSPGTIDPDYTGEVKVCLLNLGHEQVTIDPGQRIAQIVFNKVVHPTLAIGPSIELSPTKRGDGGFGSTG